MFLRGWLAGLLLLLGSTGALAQTTTHDIIIYGGGFSGVAAALNAQDAYRALKGGASARILIIDPFSKLGGLGTVNGQNFYDIRTWKSPSSTSYVQVQQGNHIRFFNQFGQFYATYQMGDWLASQVTAKGGITVLQAYDLTAVTRSTASGRITAVTARKLVRTNANWLFDSAAAPVTYTAPVIIDAGENGRLGQLAGLTQSLGRQDRNTDARQMAASLLFKVKGLNIAAIQSAAASSATTGWFYVTDADGTQAFYGGSKELANASLTALQNFNKQNPRFQIKAMNVAEDRYAGQTAGAGEFWVNALLVYGVDGRCERKDGCPDTTVLPSGFTTWSVEYAYDQTRAQLTATSAFTAALKQFTGFANFQYVTLSTGAVVAGESLYLREVAHTPTAASGSGESNFALTASEVSGAGATSTTGSDTGNFARRVGLSFYQMDTNGYTKSSSNGVDWSPDADPNPYGSPANPAYLPFDMLVTSQCPNLLLPGYSAGAGSWAWAELRVLPNLTILGDAAGVAAAYALHTGVDPYAFPQTTVDNVRGRIVTLGGRVDK